MSMSMSILAESDPTLKIIIGLAFAGLWVLAQVFSALGKKKDKTRPPELDYPVNAPQQGPSHAPPQAPMPPSRPMPQLPRQSLPPRRQPNQQVDTKQRQRIEKADAQRRKEKARQAEAALRAMHQQQRSSAPPPLIHRPAARTSDALTVADNLTDPELRRVQTGPSNSQRLSAILRPANLRREFILTELLQPPLSMRQPPPDRQ